MNRLLALFALGFGITLAVLIGRRMSTDAMAVVVGVAVGVAASVPTSLLLVALLRREHAPWQPAPDGEGSGERPAPPLPARRIAPDQVDVYPSRRSHGPIHVQEYLGGPTWVIGEAGEPGQERGEPRS